MSESVNPRSVLLTGVFIAIIGGLIALSGGILIGKALDTWDLLLGIAISLIGGFLAATGGFVSSILKRK